MSGRAIVNLMNAYGITPTEARIIVILNKDRKVMAHSTIAYMMEREYDPKTFGNVLRVMIAHIRKKAGKGVIENVWGVGYVLCPDDKMEELLK